MSKKEDLENKLSEMASDLSVWQSLMNHPGWKMYEEEMKFQREARLQVLGEPLKGFGQVFDQEFLKGEGSGIGLAMKYPELRVEILKSDVKRLETTIQLEETNASQVATDVSRGRVDNERDWHGGDDGTDAG